MSIFDKIEKEFDEDGVLRVVEKPQDNRTHVSEVESKVCECVWDDSIEEFSEMCDNHKYYISSQQDTIEVVELYKATSDDREVIWIVAEEFNDAVEMAETYFKEEFSEELMEIKASHRALVVR